MFTAKNLNTNHAGLTTSSSTHPFFHTIASPQPIPDPLLPPVSSQYLNLPSFHIPPPNLRFDLPSSGPCLDTMRLGLPVHHDEPIKRL